MKKALKILVCSVLALLFLTMSFSEKTGFTKLARAQESEKVVYAGSSTLLGIFIADAAKAFTVKTGIEVQTSGSNTTRGILTLLAGKCNLAGGGRALKEDEKSKGLVGKHIADNIIVFIVNKANQVNNLSKEQVRKIFSGEITNWKEVGGDDQRILLLLDLPKSTHIPPVRKYIMGDTDFASKGFAVKKSPEIIERVARFAPAIGFNSMALSQKNSNVKMISIDGVQASIESVLNGTYKLTNPSYLYTMDEPSGVVKQFIEFLTSDEGKQIIHAAGMSTPEG